VYSELISQGYYGNPELTAKAVDADGWYKTGDVGYFDERGALHVHGRVNDMIEIDGNMVNFFDSTFSFLNFSNFRCICPNLKTSLRASMESKEHVSLT
jgi:hypothetical protein